MKKCFGVDRMGGKRCQWSESVRRNRSRSIGSRGGETNGGSWKEFGGDCAGQARGDETGLRRDGEIEQSGNLWRLRFSCWTSRGAVGQKDRLGGGGGGTYVTPKGAGLQNPTPRQSKGGIAMSCSAPPPISISS